MISLKNELSNKMKRFELFEEIKNENMKLKKFEKIGKY